MAKDSEVMRKVDVDHFRESRKWVINPEEDANLRRWDCMMMMALIFVCLVTPYEVAFMAVGKDLAWLREGADPLFWANRLMDLLFVTDMCLQFFIMYPVHTRYGSVYVSHRPAIVRHYFMSWFWLDLVSVIPYEIIGLCVSSGDVVKLKAMRAVRMLRLLKLIRIVRGFRIFSRWQVETAFSYRKLTLWGLFATVCLSAHWMSCLLGIVSSLQGEACVTVGNPPGCVVTWLTTSGFAREEEEGSLSSFSSYFAALHVTATIIVHPYQGTPTNEAEQLCFIILVFIGGFIWTRVISRTTAVQTSLDRHGIYFRQTMDDLNMNVEDLMLSSSLQRRLRSFFSNLRDASQRSTWRDLTRRMSPALQCEVAVELHKTWLRRVPFLAGSSRLLVAELAHRIFTEHFAQQETFGSNFRLYVMNRGICSRTTGVKSRIKVLLPGSVWGLEHLVLTSARLLEPNTATGITFCDVLVLTRDNFESVNSDFPENTERIRRFFVKMAVTRGIICFARDVLKRARDEQLERLEERQTMRSSMMVNTGEPVRYTARDSDSEEEEEARAAQHVAHAARMRRELSRHRYSLLSRGSLSDMAPPSGRPSQTTTTQLMHELEDRLTQRIDQSYARLAASLEEFKEEMREGLNTRGRGGEGGMRRAAAEPYSQRAAGCLKQDPAEWKVHV